MLVGEKSLAWSMYKQGLQNTDRTVYLTVQVRSFETEWVEKASYF